VPLLELAERHQREGLGDAPWPPHYRKKAGEPARVQPSRRREPKFPLIEIARAERKEDALAGLERWKGRHADAAAHLEPADVLWAVNLGCIDMNPWPVRAADVDRPDELRVDLDPTPEAGFAQVKEVALAVNEVLTELGYRSFPKTSGSRGIHIYVRIEPRWEFQQMRRAALALAREVERRLPVLVTTAWWKEERHGVFIDYNQNARDRTVASAYSVRPTPDARVSCPLTWEELPGVELGDFTIETVPPRLAAIGDPSAGIDAVSYSLEPLLDLVARQEREGLGDAPWPPQFPKAPGEPKRVQPSRARKPAAPEDQADEKRAVPKSTSRRESIYPVITVSRAESKEQALAGLERWKARHPEAAAHLKAADVLTDSLRGRSTLWWRVRLNLRNVPEEQRPAEETPDPDYDPWAGVDIAAYRAQFHEPDAPQPPAMRTAYQRTKRKNPADGRL
jgi:DNA ligase D-like protein (predicted polymerase)